MCSSLKQALATLDHSYLSISLSKKLITPVKNLLFVYFSVNDGLIDLLVPLGLGDESRGIGFSAAGNLGPVFDIEGTATIQDTAAKYFGSKVVRDFGIKVFMKMESDSAALFSISNPYGIMQLSVVIDHVTGSQTRVNIFYTPDSRNKRRSESLTTLHMPDIKNKWAIIGIKVEGREVTLYKDCVKVDSKEIMSRDALEVEQGSTLYVGSTGSSTPPNFKV